MRGLSHRVQDRFIIPVIGLVYSWMFPCCFATCATCSLSPSIATSPAPPRRCTFSQPTLSQQVRQLEEQLRVQFHEAQQYVTGTK